MKKIILLSFLLFGFIQLGISQEASVANEIKALSLAKWQWMADKDVAKLSPLFHPQAKFEHMSGTWNTPRELEIIQSGSIWYKKADVKDTAIEIVGNTALVWNRITLHAVVGGNEVSTEFTVTEVYQREVNTSWQLLALTFSSVRDTHQLQHD